MEKKTESGQKDRRLFFSIAGPPKRHLIIITIGLGILLIGAMLFVRYPSPLVAQSVNSTDERPALQNASLVESAPAIPDMYTVNCAKCHGANGEGTAKFPELAGVTVRDEDRLTTEEVIGIINNPKAFGRSSKMPSYRDKLTEAEKNQIVDWIKSLNPPGAGDPPASTHPAIAAKTN